MSISVQEFRRTSKSKSETPGASVPNVIAPKRLQTTPSNATPAKPSQDTSFTNPR
jgi:hypothetical protein